MRAVAIPRPVASGAPEIHLPGRVLVRHEDPGLPFRWSLDPWPGRVPGFPLFEAEAGLPLVTAPSVGALAAAVRAEIREVGPGETVAIGAAADPWPAGEEDARRTRRALEALDEGEGLRLRIATRSHLVVRDRDVLARLAERHRVAVHVAIPTLDRRLAAALEPDAPRPDLRLKTVSELAGAGIPVGLAIAPALPDLTDDPGGLDRLAAAAAAAGAAWLSARAVALPPSRVRALFPGLEREFPDLADHARERWEASAALPADYRAGLADLVERLRRKHGLTGLRSPRPDVPPPVRGPQLSLL